LPGGEENIRTRRKGKGKGGEILMESGMVTNWLSERSSLASLVSLATVPGRVDSLFPLRFSRVSLVRFPKGERKNKQIITKKETEKG